MTIYFATHESPIGELLLVSHGEALGGLYMPDHKYGPRIGSEWRRDDKLFEPAKAQLDAYFAGELHRFELPIAPRGTAFQTAVWQALNAIPFGRTESYGVLSARLGNPKASRAVGLANGHNPISIIVPCHRVVGANGSLTGYGGGIERKRWLLAHETRVTRDRSPDR
jgi:methylated-DNA-[protein]-cysteine S-methyltransferase